MEAVNGELITDAARLHAAAATLRNVEVACVAGIPEGGELAAASAVVEAYRTATPLSSPIRAGESSDV